MHALCYVFQLGYQSAVCAGILVAFVSASCLERIASMCLLTGCSQAGPFCSVGDPLCGPRGTLTSDLHD